MALTEAAQAFLEALKTADFHYEYNSELEVVTILTYTAGGGILFIDFMHLPKKIGKILNIRMESNSIIIALEDKKCTLVTSDYPYYITCLDGKSLSAHNRHQQDDFLIIEKSSYIRHTDIFYEKEDNYYDRYLNLLVPTPFNFVEPLNRSGPDVTIKIMSPLNLYSAAGLTILTTLCRYVKIPPWKRINEFPYSIQTEDGKKYALVSYASARDPGNHYLVNSEEYLRFNVINPYIPDNGNPLVILNTLTVSRQHTPEIYRVDDIFLERIMDSGRFYSFKERQVVNPNCGQLTKAAICDQSTAADFVKDPVDAPIS